MKLRIYLLFAALACSACNFIEDPLLHGIPRRSTHNRNAADAGDQEDSPQDSITVTKIDTLLLYSIVEFDKSYNWDRDSSYKAESFSVHYFQNHQKLFSIKSEAGSHISPDADTHHIIDGDLYTEYSDSQRTYICKNGECVLEIDSREYLKGLVCSRDGILYTLSCDRDAEGFSLRKDGELIFRRETGRIFGSMEDSSYGQTGALYMDLGRITFCYKTGTGKNSQYYAVYDAVEEKLREEARDIDDIKVYGGTVYYSPQNQAGYAISDARIWPKLGSRPVSGHFTSKDQDGFFGICPTSGAANPLKLSASEAHIFCYTNTSFSVADDIQGGVCISDGKNSILRFEDAYFPREACAAYYDDTIILGMSRKKSQGQPFIFQNGTKTEIPLHGYISALAVKTRITN